MFKTEPEGHKLTTTANEEVVFRGKTKKRLAVECECGDYSDQARCDSVGKALGTLNTRYNVHLKEKGVR
jgi:hypothetical protein